MTQAVAVDLRGKHVIVTGASQQSLGFATAQILARWGAHVAITTRKQSSVAAARLRELSGGQVDGYDMDLTDTQSVEAFVNAYQQAHGQRLDVLINNAGIHLDLRSTW
jgi:NAD(P)-dependent dehydrogenase (short-subunit alcohol dehydrogenase family)